MNINDAKGVSSAIEVALATLQQKEPAKEGVDLVEITRKLTERKFGKRK
jgi:hypothetical protein